MNGAAFSTYVVVADNDFELIEGNLKRVKVSENASKSFCIDCGTPIYNDNPNYDGVKILHLGAIDSHIDITPAVNIYGESRLQWLEALGDIHTFEQGLT